MAGTYVLARPLLDFMESPDQTFYRESDPDFAETMTMVAMMSPSSRTFSSANFCTRAVSRAISTVSGKSVVGVRNSAHKRNARILISPFNVITVVIDVPYHNGMPPSKSCNISTGTGNVKNHKYVKNKQMGHLNVCRGNI